MKTKTIILSHLYGDSISSRNSVILLFKQLSNIDNLVLDFRKINYISRSASHQLISEMKVNADVQLVNMADSITELIEKVRNTNYSTTPKVQFKPLVEIPKDQALTFLAAV